MEGVGRREMGARDREDQAGRQPWRSNAPGVVVSSIEASVLPSAATRSVAAKSFRFVGATRFRDKRQCVSSRTDDRREGQSVPEVRPMLLLPARV